LRYAAATAPAGGPDGSKLYGLVLTMQPPAWLHGLMRLEPVLSLFNVPAPIHDLSVPPARQLVLPWLPRLALGRLVGVAPEYCYTGIARGWNGQIR
jgi:hypothetical protein